VSAVQSDQDPIRVLLVEDDIRLAQLTRRYLEGSGLTVSWITNGNEVAQRTRIEQPDAIVLDLMLPGKDGIEVCRELRTRIDVPIIMITARTGEADRVLGLDVGADDYVIKPFSSRELVSRIRAVVRRARGKVGPGQKLISLGAIRLDTAGRSVTVEGAEVPLTTLEYEILKALAQNAGQVLSRDRLLELVASSSEAFERSIDVHVSRLRQKLGDSARSPRFLKTVRGIGYMLSAPPKV
jgi:two-component system, OmpR family, response regulator